MPPFRRNGVRSDAFQINVITSDITYMKDTFCVAGWCPSASAMKRLMIDGRHWADADLKKIGKYASLNVTIMTKDGGRDYPHKTEDTWIDKNFTVVRRYDDPVALARDLRCATSKTIRDAFDGCLRENSYVPFRTDCPSLGGVILPARNITFFKNDGKLRVNLLDDDKNEYDLRVTCKYLRDILDRMPEHEFLEFADQVKGSSETAHVRVGLAKPYVYKDSNCYLMCNGIFFYNG